MKKIGTRHINSKVVSSAIRVFLGLEVEMKKTH